MDDEKTAPSSDEEILAGDVTPPGGDDKDKDKDRDKAGKDDDQGDADVGAETDEDKEDEDKEDEDKEDKEDKDKDKDLGPRRPSFKEVKEKYPNFFKDFPDLREAFFRETEYTKVFPTVEDAHEAAEELDALATLRDRVLDGDISVVFDATKEADTAAYRKLVDGFLPTLYKSDQDAFMRAITPSIENLLKSAHRDGLSSKNENLQNSALHLSQWFFGDENVALGKGTSVRRANEPDEGAKNLERERKEFEATKFRDAVNAVIGLRDTTLEKEILRGLDPENELTPYIRKKLTRDVIEEVDRVVQKDPAHMALMNAKWRRAKQDNYSQDSLQKVISAYQARAKSLIPSIRARLRDEALGGVSGKKAQRAGEVAAHKEVPAGDRASTTVRTPNPRSVDWGATSDEDILSGKVKLRR